MNVRCVVTCGWVSEDSSWEQIFSYNLVGSQIKLNHLQLTLPAELSHKHRFLKCRRQSEFTTE